ncbi:methyltransferase domain-containing protein [Thalassospira sp. MA62]|nr:methyltransferase domain-containing protein [Thalassospira sp. MA62]
MSSQLPASWITTRTPPVIDGHNQALDLACGRGRHAIWLDQQGWQVTAIDRDLSGVNCTAFDQITWQESDLETGTWPLGDRQFDLIVVVNYLHRPLFGTLRSATRPGGTIIYETFMHSNEAYGRPRSPEFLLAPDELKNAFHEWEILAFHQGPVSRNGRDAPSAVKQAIVVRKPLPRHEMTS